MTGSLKRTNPGLRDIHHPSAFRLYGSDNSHGMRQGVIRQITLDLQHVRPRRWIDPEGRNLEFRETWLVVEVWEGRSGGG